MLNNPKKQIESLEAQLTAVRTTAENNLKRATEAENKLAQAEKKLAEAGKTATAGGSAADKRVTDLEAALKKAESEADMKDRQIASLQQRLTAAEARVRQMVTADEAERKAAAEEQAKEGAAVSSMKEHKLTADETLSHLALKYYGSAYEPYWRVIYEANKDLIGDNPARVRPGMMIKIPPLPEELKNKK